MDEKIKEFIKENLRIETEEYTDGCCNTKFIKVKLVLCNEVISEDYIQS